MLRAVKFTEEGWSKENQKMEQVGEEETGYLLDQPFDRDGFVYIEKKDGTVITTSYHLIQFVNPTTDSSQSQWTWNGGIDLACGK